MTLKLNTALIPTHTRLHGCWRWWERCAPSTDWCWGMCSSTNMFICVYLPVLVCALIRSDMAPLHIEHFQWHINKYMRNYARTCEKRRVCALTWAAGRMVSWSPLWLSHRPRCYVTRSLRCLNAGPHARPACLPVHGGANASSAHDQRRGGKQTRKTTPQGVACIFDLCLRICIIWMTTEPHTHTHTHTRTHTHTGRGSLGCVWLQQAPCTMNDLIL